MYHQLVTEYKSANPSTKEKTKARSGGFKEVKDKLRVIKGSFSLDDSVLLSECKDENDTLDQSSNQSMLGVSGRKRKSKNSTCSSSLALVSLMSSISSHLDKRDKIVDSIGSLLQPIATAMNPIEVKDSDDEKCGPDGRPFKNMSLWDLQKRVEEQEKIEEDDSKSARMRSVAHNILAELDQEMSICFNGKEE